MTWRVAYSLNRLRDQVNAQWPDRNKASDGTIGDASHQAVPSDHNPNAQGVVCALDITHSPETGFDAHALADKLLNNRHPDLKYIISHERIAGAWSNWQWEQYTGQDPHIQHIHISVGVGPDGQSVQPYDDTNDWAVGEEMIEDTDGNFQLWQRTAQIMRYEENGFTRDQFRDAAVGKTWPDALWILINNPATDENFGYARLGEKATKENWEAQIANSKYVLVTDKLYKEKN